MLTLQRTRIWFLLFVGLCCGLIAARQAFSAENTASPTHDATVDPANPTTNYNEEALLVGYSSFDGNEFQSTTRAYLQFDLSSFGEDISTRSLQLHLTNNQILADEVQLVLYSLSTDAWDEATLQATFAPTVQMTALQTMTIRSDTAGIVYFNAPTVGAFLEAERNGDGVASFIVKITDATGDRFGGLLVFDDSEGSNPPALVVAVVSAVGLGSLGINETLIALPLALLLLTLITITALRHVHVSSVGAIASIAFSKAAARQTVNTFASVDTTMPFVSPQNRPDLVQGRDKWVEIGFGHWRLTHLPSPYVVASRLSKRLKHLMIVIIVPIVLLSGLWRLQPSYAAATSNSSCTAVTPEVAISAENSNVKLTWTDDSANTLGYKVWRTTDDAFFDADAEPMIILPAGTSVYNDMGVLTDDGTVYVYVVAGVALCGDSEVSNPVAAKQVALNTTPWAYNFVTIPFEMGIENATDLAAFVGEFTHLTKFDEATGVARMYTHGGFGDNFPIAVGDTVIIASNENTPATLTFAGRLAPRVFTLSTQTKFVSTPAQFNIGSTLEVSSSFSVGGGEIRFWNNETQQFEMSTEFEASGGTIRIGDPIILIQTSTEIVTDSVITWPPETQTLVWADLDSARAATRSVYLRWTDTNYDPSSSQYDVQRRKLGDSAAWETLNTVSLAPDENAFGSILGNDLANALIAQEGVGDIAGLFDKLKADRDLARGYAQLYPQVALAIGMAYIDSTADSVTDYEYYVSPAGSIDAFPFARPICAPATPTPFSTLSPRETMPVTVPVGLGEFPSSRPLDAAERYDWDLAQQWRGQDGQIFLDWNLPASDDQFDDPWTCLDAEHTRLAGYHIYRDLELAEYDPVRVDVLGNPQLIQVGSQSAEFSHPFIYQDDLRAVYPDADLTDIYARYSYHVCPVDFAGQEGACEVAFKLPVRDLEPPNPVSNTQAVLNNDHTQLTLTWDHSVAGEVFTDVDFFVMRSPTLTLPITQWEELTPSGTPSATHTVAQTPDDVNVLYWYRVQVRDAAGNWSPAGAAVSAMFADRTAPNSPINTSGEDDCLHGTLPIDLSINDDAVLVHVYRSFVHVDGDTETQVGPYQFITTLDVADGAVSFDEQNFQPPDNVSVRYRFVSVDAHGNMSDPIEVCAVLASADLPEAPNTSAEVVDHPSGKGLVIVITGDVPPSTTVTVTVAGSDPIVATVDENGEIVYASAEDEARVTAALENGGDVHVAVTTTDAYGRQSEPDEEFIGGGDILNGVRSFTNLGPLFNVDWTHQPDEAPKVTLFISDKLPCDGCADHPFIAVFRRAGVSGAWLQVTPLVDAQTLQAGPAEGWQIDDTADPSPNQAHDYRVVAFSPLTFEMIGAWETFSLAAFDSSSVVFDLGGSPVSPESAEICGDEIYEAPTVANLPATLTTQTGWQINVDQYRRTTDGVCIPNTFTLGDANGVGTLDLDTETVGVNFYDLVLAADGKIQSGRIVVEAGDRDVFLSNGMMVKIGRIEILPDATNAEFSLTLTDTLNLIDKGLPSLRTNQLVGTLESLSPTLDEFDPLISDLYNVVEEKLPWILNTQTISFTNLGFLLNNVTTTYRLEQPLANRASLPQPDNNLHFLAPTYHAASTMVEPLGLSGSFSTTEPIRYATSMPAGFVVSAESADIQLFSSELYFSTLFGGSAELTYYTDRQVRDGIIPGADLAPPRYYTDTVRNAPTLQQLAIGPDFGTFQFDMGGALNATVNVTGTTNWLSFELANTTNLLSLAKAQPFVDPVENISGGNSAFMPPAGLHLQAESFYNNTTANLTNDCFQIPSIFDANSQVYLRLGGASSGFFLDLDAPQSAFYDDFQVTIERFSAGFLDNWVAGELVMGLYLPYPSDISVTATYDQFDQHGCVQAGTVTPTLVTHDYWNLTQYLSGTVAFVPMDAALYGSAPFAKLVQFNGTTQVNGISAHDSTTDQMLVPLVSHWQPNGDSGHTEIRGSETHWPDTIRSLNTITTAPFLPIGQVNGMEYTPERLLLPPRYSTPGHGTSLPSLGGVDMTHIQETYGLDDGDISAETLRDCAQAQGTGCGSILIDGESAVDYFGELRPSEEQLTEVAEAYRPHGAAALGVYNNLLEPIKGFLNNPALQWRWRTPQHNVVATQYGMQLMVHPEGGALVGVFTDFQFIPDANVEDDIRPTEILSGDISYAITFDYAQNDVLDEVGIFMGYAAAPAALRTLAMNRPDIGSPDAVEPFDEWDDVSADIERWTDFFRFTNTGQNDTDCGDRQTPSDLLQPLWEQYATTQMHETTDLVQPAIDRLQGLQCYSLQPLESGRAVYDTTYSWFGGGLASATFSTHTFGNDDRTVNNLIGDAIVLEQLDFGTHLRVYLPEKVSLVDDFIELDQGTEMLRATWLQAKYTRDGLMDLYGRNIRSELDAFGVDALLEEIYADFHLQLTFDGVLDANAEAGIARIEGGIDLYNVKISEVNLKHIVAVFGSGNVEGAPIGYIGGTVDAEIGSFEEGSTAVYPFGGRLLAGTIYDSPILREHGFGDIIDKFLADAEANPSLRFEGWYANLYASFPLYNDSLVEINGYVDIGLWRIRPITSDNYALGGYLEGAVYGSVAYVISGRGTVLIVIEELPEGAQSTSPGNLVSQTCSPASPNGECLAYTGSIWVAAGIGSCEPRKWRQWEQRWWRDSWCYQGGAIVGLSVLDDGNATHTAIDYDIDWE